MEEKKQVIGGITFTGPITVNGPMFDIHDNQHVHIHQGGTSMQHHEEEGNIELVDLSFFSMKMFGTMESQGKLRQVLQDVLPKINVESGRDWVAVYIAYHFFINSLQRKGNYVCFFTDIEKLLPGVLTKVNTTFPKGDKRYRAYTEALSDECNCWFIDEGRLPPMNEWVSSKYNYQVKPERKKQIQSLVSEIYRNMK